jgi:hypothetical protein
MSPSLSLLASHPWTYTPCLLLPGYFSELAHIEAPPAGLLRSSAAEAAPAPTAQCEEAHVADLDRRRQAAAAAAIVAAKRAEHVQPRMPWETPRAVSAAVVAEWRALLSLRQLVVEANQCATRAVSQGQFERARSLLGPALDAMRSLPPFCPPPLMHALSGLNATTLCGLHLAAGRPAEALLVGEHGLAMEAARGGGDNPVGLRLGMAAAQAAVGSVYAHERAVVLLQQAASTGLQQLRRLEHTGPPAPAAATEPRLLLPLPQASTTSGVALTVGASPRRATRNATTASPRAAAAPTHPPASYPRPVSARRVCAVMPSTACTGSLSSTPKANATAPDELHKASAPAAATPAAAAAAVTATAPPATPQLREDLMLLPASPMPPMPPMPAAHVLAVDGLDLARRQQLQQQLLRAIVLAYHQTALSLSALGRPAHAAEAQHQAARLCRAAGGAASDLLRPMQGALRAATRQAAPYRPDRPSDWFAMAPPPAPPPLRLPPPPSPLEQLLLASIGQPTNQSALLGVGASRRPQTAHGPAAGAPAHPAGRPTSAGGPFDGARRPAPGFSVPLRSPRSPRSQRSPRRAEGQGVAPAALQQARGAGGFRNVLMPAPAMPALKEVVKGHTRGHPWRLGPKGLESG